MKQISALFPILLLSWCSVSAQHLSANEARRRILSSGSPALLFPAAKRANAAQQEPVLPLCYSSRQLYAFTRSDGGFILSSSSPSLPPVLGYSDPSRTFGQALRTQAFATWIQAAESHIQQFLSDEQDGQNRLSPVNTMGPIHRPAGTKTRVSPLTRDLWHQYKPFNTLCPITGQGDTCVTGCVATAMAQVMNYWKYPDRGKGTHTYTDTKGCGQTLSADFESHCYDWSQILDSYYEPYTDRQAQAVATLLSDCGIAVDMQYGAGSSGARSIRQCQALVRHFQYDEGVQMYYRSFFSQQEWDSLMFTELSLGRPIIVSAYSPTLGHSLTCDGYDEQGLFHLNFGNPEGDANGYYYFTWLTPHQPTWYDSDSPEGGLNLLQSITIGVQPARPGSPPRHFYGFSHIIPLGPDSIVVCNLANLGWNEHNGTVGIALKPAAAPEATAADTTVLLYRYGRKFLLEEITDTSYTDTLRLTWPADRNEGDYRICPVFEENGLLKEARTQQGTPNYLMVHTAKGKHTLMSPASQRSHLRISGISIPDTVEQASYPEFSFTISNEGAEYNGRIYIALATRLTPWGQNIFAREGLSLDANASCGRHFRRTRIPSLPAGEYQMRFYADSDVFTDSLQAIPCDSTATLHIVPAGSLTGINDLTDGHTGSATEQPVYNLNGQRLTRLFDTLGPGIYIRNGQKVIKTK